MENGEKPFLPLQKMAAQQRGSCKNEFGAEKQRWSGFSSFPFFSSLGPFLISSAGRKAPFWALLLLPYFPLWRRSKCTSMAWLLDFSLWQAQEKSGCSQLIRQDAPQGQLWKWVGQKAEAALSWKYCTGTLTTGLEGAHKGGDISKRGKGRCKSVEQSLSCGRKARGNSGLHGELQEQNNPCLPLAVEGPHPHKQSWPSSGRLDDPICSENVIL